MKHPLEQSSRVDPEMGWGQGIWTPLTLITKLSSGYRKIRERTPPPPPLEKVGLYVRSSVCEIRLSFGPAHFRCKGCWVGFFFSFYSNFNRTLSKQTGDTDQTPRSVLFDLGLYCLPMPHKKDARLIWVKG